MIIKNGKDYIIQSYNLFFYIKNILFNLNLLKKKYKLNLKKILIYYVNIFLNILLFKTLFLIDAKKDI